MLPQAINSTVFIISLILGMAAMAGMWGVFEKCGEPGVAAIIPIWREYCLCQVADKPGWWLILFFVPIVNIIIYFIVMFGIAEAYGRGIGFGLGLVFFPFIFFPGWRSGSSSMRHRLCPGGDKWQCRSIQWHDDIEQTIYHSALSPVFPPPPPCLRRRHRPVVECRQLLYSWPDQ